MVPDHESEILNYIEGSRTALEAQEIRNHFRLSRQRVHTVLRRLLKSGRIRRVQRGVYASLHLSIDYVSLLEREIRWVAGQQLEPFSIEDLSSFVGYSSWTVGKVLRKMFQEHILIRVRKKMYAPVFASVPERVLTAKTRILRLIHQKENAVSVKTLMEDLRLKRGTINLALKELVDNGQVRRISRGLYLDPEMQSIGPEEIQNLFDFIKERKIISKKEIARQFGEKTTENLKKLLRRGLIERKRRGWYSVVQKAQ